MTSFRTPFESFCCKVDSNDVKKLSDYSLNQACKLLNNVGDLFSFHVSDEVKEKLTTKGINLNPFPFQAHSHAASKMIENHCLFVVLPELLGNGSWTFLSMKQKKLERLYKMCKVNQRGSALLNRIICAKDKCRYFDARSDPNSTVDIFDFVKLVNTKNIFVHDEIHHWSKQTMFNVLKKGNFNLMIATVVYPVEVLAGEVESHEPKIYQFSINGNTMTYAPDGNYNESYEQQSNLEWLFSASHLLVNGQYWTVKKVSSVYSHHIFLFVKGELYTESERVFSDFETIDMTKLNRLRKNSEFPPIKKTIFDKVYAYLMCLKKADDHSGFAKYRQLIGDDVDTRTSLFFEQMCQVVIEHRKKKMPIKTFCSSFFGDCYLKLIEAEPDLIARIMPNGVENMFFSFISSLGLLRVKIKTRVIKLNESEDGLKELNPLINNMDNLWHNGGDFSKRFDRKPSPYSITGDKKKSLLNYHVIVKKGFFLLSLYALDHNGWQKTICGNEKNATMYKDIQHGKFFLVIEKSRLSKLNPIICTGWEVDNSIDESKFLDEDVDVVGLDDEIGELISIKDKKSIEENVENKIINHNENNSAKLDSYLLNIDDCMSIDSLDDHVERKIDSVCTRNEEDEPANFEIDESSSDEFHGATTAAQKKKEKKEENFHEETDLKFIKFNQESSTRKDKENFENNHFSESNSDEDYSMNPQNYAILINCENPEQIDNGDVPGDGFCFFHSLSQYFEMDSSTLIFELKKSSRKESFIENNFFSKRVMEEFNDQIDNGYVSLNTASVISHLMGIEICIHNFDRINQATLLKPRLRSLNKKAYRACIKHRNGHFNLKFRLEDNEIKLKNSCVLNAISKILVKGVGELLKEIKEKDIFLFQKIVSSDFKGLNQKDLSDLSIALGIVIYVRDKDCSNCFGVSGTHVKLLITKENHVEIDQEGSCLSLTFQTPLNDSRNTEDDLGILNSNLIIYPVRKNFCLKLIESFDKGSSGVMISTLEIKNSIEQKVNKSIKIISDEFSKRILPRISTKGKQNDTNGERFKSKIKEIEKNGKVVNFIVGFAGSGKSFSLKKKIGLTKDRVLVISPRKKLADEWESSSGRKGIKVTTFEKAIVIANKSDFDHVIIDELTLCPPGYLDLIICLCPRSKITALFDPSQSDYHCPSDSHILTFIHDSKFLIDSFENYGFKISRDKKYFEEDELNETENKSLDKKIILNLFEDQDKKEKIKYLFYSLRFNNHPCFANFKEFFPEDPFKKKMTISFLINDLVKEDLVIVGSNAEETYLESIGVNALTVSKAQGLTFRRVSILFSESLCLCNDKMAMVCLTRATEHINFCFQHASGLEGFVRGCRSNIFKKVCKNIKLDISDLPVIGDSNKFDLIGVNSYGADEVEREERLIGDPFLKPFIHLGQRVELFEYDNLTVNAIEESVKCHLPIITEGVSHANLFSRMKPKESREFRIKTLCSNQFAEQIENRPGCVEKVAGPYRYKAIFPRHKMDDDMTFLMACKKRLRFSDTATELRKLNSKFVHGRLLFENFIRVIPNIKKINKFDVMFSRNEFEKKKLSKPISMLENHNARSCVDWRMNEVFLFMKNQLCTKIGKQFTEAKAGQTLACFSHMVLVKFAPICRAMEKVFRESLPDNFYIHSNKNFDDLNFWCLNHFENDICVESDYEAFDSSQDHVILAFEICLMRHMGVDEFIIQDYIDLKVNLGCKLGHFAIMRFTGEFCTFFFNTLSNMAFTFARYDIKGNEPIAFAGDDMCSLRNIKVSNSLNKVLEQLSLKAVVLRTDSPTFCGWHLSKHGIVKNPELIFHRFMVATEDGKLKDCLESYAIEASYAYRLGEKLFDVLKERLLEYHYLVIRLIVKNLHLIKGDVSSLFRDVDIKDSEIERSEGDLGSWFYID